MTRREVALLLVGLTKEDTNVLIHNIGMAATHVIGTCQIRSEMGPVGPTRLHVITFDVHVNLS